MGISGVNKDLPREIPMSQQLKRRSILMGIQHFKARTCWLFYLGLLAIGLLGSAALLRSSPYGLGLSSDTVAYVNGAENIAKGNGYATSSGSGGFKPITGFPPMFSILLAPLSLLGLDILLWSRLLIVGLFGLDIFLVGLLAYRITNSTFFSLLAALLLAVSDILLEVYVFLLSEPLFITLMLAAIYFFSKFFDNQRRVWLLLTGFLLGLASLTRLPGIWVLVCVILTILLFETNWPNILSLIGKHTTPQPTHDKIRLLMKELAIPIKEISLVLVTSLPLILIWVFYTFSLNTGLGNRSLIWHPIPFHTLIEGVKNLLSWLSPKSIVSTQPFWGQMLSLVSLLLLPGLFGYLLWQIGLRLRSNQDIHGVASGKVTVFCLGLHIVSYILFMVVTISLLDASEPLNTRLLSVVYIPLIILFTSSLAWTWRFISKLRGKQQLIGRIVFVFFCAGLIFTSVSDGIVAVKQLGREGLGYANRSFMESKAFEDIRNLPPVQIFSNNPGSILLFTGKPATINPTPINPMTTLARPDYLQDVNDIRQLVVEGKAVLVLFDMNNKSNPDKYSIFKTLTTGLPLMKDYGNVQMFGRLK
jgi:hypothetical protein